MMMPFRHQHRIVHAASGALLAVVVGCQMPSFARHELEALPASHKVKTAVPKLPPKPPSNPQQKPASAAESATAAEVMRAVQQITADDPAAGKLLLEELSRVEPKLWPLTLQQFRAQQAFHKQLLDQPKATIDQPAGEPADVAATEPPSAQIGRLADPRSIRSDPEVEQAFAQATPANMPAPLDPATPSSLAAKIAPAAFAKDVAAAPLSTQTTRADRGPVVRAATASSGEVVPAVYNSDVAATEDSPRLDWQQHLKLAIADLNQRLADGPRSTAEVHQLVSLRMLELLSGNTEAALKPIPNVSTQEQDYWSSQLFALATLLDHHRQPDDDRRAAASVVHLDEAVGHLREIGTLSLRNLAFCKAVFGYGAYEPINDPTFTPGQQVTLYLEVENYHSESTQKGYATKLGASYELVNAEGERVAGGEFPNVEDCCQSRRRDFHIQYGLVLPKTAKPGEHHLKLVMNDLQSDKVGSASILMDIR